MTTPANANPMITEPQRFSIRLPRPLWLGLGTVVLVIVAVGVEFVIPIWRQQVAIREIRRVGGRIQIQQRGPEWLRKRLGDEHMTYFDQVVMVELTVKSANDPALRHLAALHNLKVLWLGNSRITDDGLTYLSGLISLEQLWLGNTGVTNAGLAHLGQLRNLHDLSLGITRVSDAGLEHLKGLRSLQQLALRNTEVTDAGVVEFKQARPGLKIDR